MSTLVGSPFLCHLAPGLWWYCHNLPEQTFSPQLRQWNPPHVKPFTMLSLHILLGGHITMLSLSTNFRKLSWNKSFKCTHCFQITVSLLTTGLIKPTGLEEHSSSWILSDRHHSVLRMTPSLHNPLLFFYLQNPKFCYQVTLFELPFSARRRSPSTGRIF